MLFLGNNLLYIFISLYWLYSQLKKRNPGSCGCQNNKVKYSITINIFTGQPVKISFKHVIKKAFLLNYQGHATTKYVVYL